MEPTKQGMEKVRQFQERAAECREWVLKGPTPDIRAQYQALAEIWQTLAEERLAYLDRKDAGNGD